MNRTILCVVVFVAFALSMLSIRCAAQSAGQTVILTGIVSCRQCRKIHPAKGGWTDSSCTMRCVREGSDFVLVVPLECVHVPLTHLTQPQRSLEAHTSTSRTPIYSYIY